MVIDLFDNLISYNIGNPSSSSELPSYQYIDNEHATSEDIHKNHVTQANTSSNSNKVQNRKSSDSNELKKELEQTQVLIAEDEGELVLLFREYLSASGLKSETADSGDKAIDCFHGRKTMKKPYDAIIVDTHLHNPSGLDVVKRIRSEKPDQKMILVTTTPKENLPVDCLKTAGIKDDDILTMPFKLSKLTAALTKSS